MDRVRSEAETKVLQGRVFRFLAESKDALVAAAERGELPAAAISDALLRVFGDKVRSPRVRQFIGLCIAAFLEEAGYEVARSGVRLPDNQLFTVATFFRRVPAKGTSRGSTSLLTRWIDALTETELRLAAEKIEARLARIGVRS